MPFPPTAAGGNPQFTPEPSKPGFSTSRRELRRSSALSRATGRTGGSAEQIRAAAIIREDTREVLYFQSMPQEIGDTSTPNWNDVQILGRSEPIRVYANTSARTFTFPLQFHAFSDAREDVVNKVNFLRALQFPRYVRNVALNPPVFFLVIGDWLNERLICKSADVAWRGPWQIGFDVPDEMVPMVAEVNLTCERVSQHRS